MYPCSSSGTGKHSRLLALPRQKVWYRLLHGTHDEARLVEARAHSHDFVEPVCFVVFVQVGRRSTLPRNILCSGQRDHLPEQQQQVLSRLHRRIRSVSSRLFSVGRIQETIRPLFNGSR